MIARRLPSGDTCALSITLRSAQYSSGYGSLASAANAEENVPANSSVARMKSLLVISNSPNELSDESNFKLFWIAKGPTIKNRGPCLA